MDGFLHTDVAVWCSTFWHQQRQIELPDFTDGIFLNQVFCEIANYDWTAVEPLLSNKCVNTRLQNWKLLVKNLEQFYMDELNHLIVMAPPGIFHIIYSPSSHAAATELERIALLLLLAAIKCERRDLYIRVIMNNLTVDVQKGIMECITNLTENPDNTLSLSDTCDVTPELRYSILKSLFSRDEIYFQLAEEVIHRICDFHPAWTPTKGSVTKRPNQTLPAKMTRSRSLASSLELISGAFKKIANGNDSPNSSQSVNTDTATTSETGYESRVGTEKVLKDQIDLLETSDLDAILGALETQSLCNEFEKVKFITKVKDARAKLRRQANIISEQIDQLAEMHSQLVDSRSELGQLREERARLADAATSARHWRDEADAGQQAMSQLRDAEHTCNKLKQRLEAAHYYKIRCQELSEEIDTLTKERNDLESRLSVRTEEQANLKVIDEKLAEKLQKIADLEWQHEKDLEEIYQLKTALTESQFERVKLSQNQLSTRSVSPVLSENGEPPFMIELHRELAASSSADVQKMQKQLEEAIERYASQLQDLRSQLARSGDTASTTRPLPLAGELADKVDTFLGDLETVIRDIIDTVRDNDSKLEKFKQQQLKHTASKFSQVDLDVPPAVVLDDDAFARSTAFAKSQMTSAQDAFRESAEAICGLLTEAIVQTSLSRQHCEAPVPQAPRASVTAASATQTNNSRPIDGESQTSPELQAISSGEYRPYRICNQFGTPLQLSVVHPHRVQRSASTCNGEMLAPPRSVCNRAVNTSPQLGEPRMGVNEAVREALLQASETKKRLRAVSRENSEAKEEVQMTRKELESCTAFLEEYEKRNSYLEKENRTLLLQLRSLLSQNQGVLMDALDNNESHYREKIALRDELALLKRHKERLEEKIFEQYKTLPSPKKAKQSISLMQKARDAINRKRDGYVFDHTNMTASNAFGSVDLQELSDTLRRTDGAEDTKNLRDLHAFLGNLDKKPQPKRQEMSESACQQKSQARWGYPAGDSTPLPRRCLSDYPYRPQARSSSDNSTTSLFVKQSPRFPMTDRGEDDHYDARFALRKPTVAPRPEIINFSAPTRSLSAQSEPVGRRCVPVAIDLRPVRDVTPNQRSEAFSKRRIPSATGLPTSSSFASVSSGSSASYYLGGLAGPRRKPLEEDRPVTSFAHPRSRRNSGDAEMSPPTTPVNSVSVECLAKPVVFLEYGDL